MNYYYVTFSNGYSRRNVYAESPKRAEEIAMKDMPPEWSEDDTCVICVEVQEHPYQK